MVGPRVQRPALLVFVFSLIAFFALSAVISPWAANAANSQYWNANLNANSWRLSTPGSIHGGEIQVDSTSGYGSTSAKVQTQNGTGHIYFSATGSVLASMSHVIVANSVSACMWYSPTGGTTNTYTACWKYQ